MNILRQGTSFLLIGGCLVLVDWGVFVLLSAIGVNTPVANVAGRVFGALLSFIANGSITFSSVDGARFGKRRFARFMVLWLPMTILSTYMVSEVAIHLSLKTAWLGKPLVEGFLATVSFVLSRHWVYR
jgi:putative flippase GtrA